MANFWGGWTPPRHSGTWVGARVASLRCHYPPPRRSQYSRNAKARPHKSKTSCRGRHRRGTTTSGPGRGPLAGFEVTLYGRFWGDRRGNRHVGQQHQWRLAEAVYHHQPELLGSARQANRLGAVTQIVDLLLPILDFNDARLMTEPAPPRYLGHAALQLAPVDHRALAGGADDEALTAVQQGFQQLLAVAATIDGPDPSPLGMRPDQVHGGQHFGVLAGEVLRLGRVQFLIEGNDFAAVDLLSLIHI